METPREVREELQGLRITSSLNCQMPLQTRLFRLRTKKDDNLRVHLDEMLNSAQQLTTAGKEVPNQDMVVFILITLQESYEN